MRRACLILVLVALFLGASTGTALAGHALNDPVATTNPGDFWVSGNMDCDGTSVWDGVATFNADAIFTLDVSVGADLTVAGLVYGRQPTAQYYKATATDTVQDLNVSTAVAIRWGTETLEDTGFTHGTTSLKSRCYLDAAGWYKVSYSITHTNGTGMRRTIRCYGKMNSSTVVTPSRAYGHSRNDINQHGTATAVFLVQTTGANEYLQIFGQGIGEQIDVATANSTLDECWVLIERID